MELHYVYQVKCGICQNWVPHLGKVAVSQGDKGLKEPGLLGQPGMYQQSTKASDVQAPSLLPVSDCIESRSVHHSQLGDVCQAVSLLPRSASLFGRRSLPSRQDCHQLTAGL